MEVRHSVDEMCGSHAAPASTLTPAGVPPEWLIVRTRRPHVLITGSDASIEVLLATLRPSLQVPVRQWASDQALPAPHDAATLFIRDVATLSLEQQHALLSWLDHVPPGHPQVVSTTSLELFPLVERGTFLDVLYYRLNTVRLDAPRS